MLTKTEKLHHLHDSVLLDVTARSSTIIEEYKAGLDALYCQHKQEAQKRAAAEIKQREDRLVKQQNKEVSMEHIRTKQLINQQVQELKQVLLEKILTALEEYMDTPNYLLMLTSQINQARETAREDEIHIYIDRRDKDLSQKLKEATGLQPEIAETPHIGGIKALIPARKILIDQSFASKLQEIQDNFTLTGGDIYG